MQRVCHHCGHDVADVERIGRRDTCLHCRADLRCCLNCRFHDRTCHNECREPQAERQVDKRVGNFCEYFSFRDGRAPATAGAAAASARARLDSLFAKRK